MRTTITIECDSTKESRELFTALANIGSNTVSVRTCTPKCNTSTTKLVKTAVQVSTEVTEELPSREELESTAKELGVPFRSDIGDKGLYNKIKATPKTSEPTKTESVPLSDEDEDKASDDLMDKIKAEHGAKPKEVVEDEEVPEDEQEPEKSEEQEAVEEPEEEEQTTEVIDSKVEVEESDDDLSSALNRRKRRAVKTRNRREEGSSKISWD